MVTLLGLLSLPALIMMRGFVLQKLWGWFIVSHFHIAPLNIPEALGIAVLVSTLTNHQCKRDEQKPHEVILLAMLNNGLVLFLGWLYSLFL